MVVIDSCGSLENDKVWDWKAVIRGRVREFFRILRKIFGFLNVSN